MADKFARRTVLVPTEVDHQIIQIADQVGMSPDQLYSYLAKSFVEFPTSVLKTHMTDLFRRMNVKPASSV